MKTTIANQWTRRDFTVQSALAMLSGVAITLAGCGDSNSPSTPTPTATPPTPTPPAGNSDITGAVGANHGHSAVITAAELTAANALTLDISGDSNHPHSVALTATEVGQMAGGMRVQKTSTNNSGHTHTVTFN